MSLITLLQDLQDNRTIVSVTLSCKLGNPPEQQYLSKWGVIRELTINDEKPRQSSFYIEYLERGRGGATKFKASPHEVVAIFKGLDAPKPILYSSDEENETAEQE